MKQAKEEKEEFTPKDRLKFTKNWGPFGRLDTGVFIIAVIVCFGFIVWGAINHESLSAILDKALAATMTNWKWMYQGGVLFFVAFCFVLAFSKYGKIKFGKDDDKPEYSNFSWFAMLFGAGMGVGLVFWSVAEPITHYLSGPAYAPEGGTVEAAEWAMAISYMHWGISPWAIFVILGIPLGIVVYRKGLPSLVSSCFYPILGNKIYGPIGKVIDIISLCITFVGVSVTIGLGTMELGAGLKYGYGIEQSNELYIILLVIVAAAYLASACLPIEKGIKRGSNISMVACIGLLIFLFILGPTQFILNNFVNGVGVYLQNFIMMSTWTDPAEQSTWLQSWTVFYWAWWISWAPFVGMFIAKISKGRTIKEFVIAALIIPTLFDIVFIDIVGSSALSFEMDPATQGIIASAISEDTASGIFVLFGQFPLTQLVIPVLLVVIFTFFVVSADSATIVLGMFSSGGDNSPRTSLKILWGVAMAASAGILMVMGGLKAVQTVSIVAVLPFIFIMFGLCYSTYKMLKGDASDTLMRKEDISD